MRSKDSRDYVLSKAYKELAEFRHKYIGLSELADVFAAIDDALSAA